MKFIQGCLFLAVFFLLSFLYVNESYAKGNFYLGVVAGSSIAKLNDNHTIVNVDALGNNWIYEYRATSGFKGVPLVGLNGGYEFLLPKHFFLDLGIAFYDHINDFSSNGEIWITAGDLREHLYNYKYKVSNTSLLGEAKLGVKISTDKFLPFILVGIGTSWNRAKDFSATPLSTLNADPFPPHSCTEFAYQLGVGVEYQIFAGNYVGFTYKYTDLGSAEFAIKDPIEFPHKLDVGKIRTSDLLLTFTHRFN